MTRYSSNWIRVNDLLAEATLGTGASWPTKPDRKGTLQQISISLAVPYDIGQTAATDDLTHSISYSDLSSAVRKLVASRSFSSLDDLVDSAQKKLLEFRGVDSVWLKVVQLKGPVHCLRVGVEFSTTTGFIWFLQDIDCHTVVGINTAERDETQSVILNVSITNKKTVAVDFRALTRHLYMTVGGTNYLTLEALASFVAEQTLSVLAQSSDASIELPNEVNVKASKPSALVFASSSEVEITRSYEDYLHLLPTNRASASRGNAGVHTAAIAVGANMGDRFHNLEYALRLLESPQQLLPDNGSAFVRVVDTGFMYESVPMYVTDQAEFANSACLIETDLEPLTLLKLLKAVEQKVGRVPGIRNGPRAVDLDLSLYDDITVDTRADDNKANLDNLTGELLIPHPRMSEREFVLRPLSDMIPDYIHPVRRKCIKALLNELLAHSKEPPMRRVLPFPRTNVPAEFAPRTLTQWTYPYASPVPSTTKHKTHLMATLNTTPDSFSDGSEHNTIATGLAYVEEALEARASIVDVGGYSTRPGASDVSPEEEIRRVVPMIEAIRGHPNARDVLISVDSFRPEVAKVALKAGANCINDVYAFTGPGYPQEDEQCFAQMKAISREFAAPVVLMHSRGEAGQNKNYEQFDYAPEGGRIIEAVRVELGAKIDKIVKGPGGVRRWLVVVDPGIGFSKTVEGNLELLRHGFKVTEDVVVGHGIERRRNPLASYPTLVGASRKSFLGAIITEATGKESKAGERDWATAAAVSCAIQQGADIVRVHACKHMSDVVEVSQALWA